MSLDFLFVPLAAKVGASLDQVKIITCLLVSYPLSSLFARIPTSNPTFRHLFNIVISSFYFVTVLNYGIPYLWLLGDVLVTYIITLTVQSPRMPWIVFCIMMGHLSFNHITRTLYADPFDGSYSITGPQMVLVMKLTTFAWNVWDGRRPVEDLDKFQTKMRVTKFPSLLQFLGFSLYFPGILVGPYIEYANYSSLIDGTLWDVTDGSQPRKSMIPTGRKRAAYLKLLLGLGFLAVYMAVRPNISFHTTMTDWFLEQSLPSRILIIQIAGFVERSKYYSVWILTEGASILTGLGFIGYSPSGTPNWNGATNVNVLGFAFAENFKVLLDSWNVKTNVWLRECVYKRLTHKGKKGGFKSDMLTKLTSALWHGVYPGYYLTFAVGGFISTSGRLARSTVRPLVLPAVPQPIGRKPANGQDSKPSQQPASLFKTLYDIAGIVYTALLINFIAVPFYLLHLTESIEAWRRLHYHGLWMVFGPMAFFYGGGATFLMGIQAKRMRRANANTPSINGPSAAGVVPEKKLL